LLSALGAALEPVSRLPAKVRDSQHRDPVGLDDVADGEGEPGQEEPPDSGGLSDARPERPGHRALGDGVEGVAHLVGEVDSEAGKLTLVPIARRREVGRGSRVEADLHALPSLPALSEARLDGFPVLGRDRTRPQLAGALLEFPNPGLGRVGVRSVIQA
jgi:hypothetical protein